MRHWPDRFLHAALRADGETQRRARLTVLLAVVLLAVAVSYALFYAVVVGYPMGAAVLAMGAIVVAIVLPILRLRPWLRAAGHLVTAVVFGVVVGLMICEGGAGSLATPLLSLPPILAILLLGRREGATWTVLAVLTLVVFGALDAQGVRFPLRYPMAWAARMRVGSPVALVVCTAALLRMFENLRVDAQARADAANAALARLAYRDALTGLPNRAQFLERLDLALAGAGVVDDHSRVALLLLDLDGFKAVNDGMGHAAGDALLAAVGARVLNATRGSDTVARLGGDEFAVLLDGVCADADVIRVADRIVTALAQPFPLAAGAARIGVSIGIARGSAAAAAPRAASAQSPEARHSGASTARGPAATVLHEADVAMYRAKAAGGGRAVVFAAGMALGAPASLESGDDARGASEPRRRPAPAPRGASTPCTVT